MIAVSHPQLRPEVGAKIAKYSQREMDLLDLAANDLVTVPIADVLADKAYPNLHLFVSVMKDGHLYDPYTRDVEGQPRDLFLTFNNLISKTGFVKIVGRMLAVLEKAYGHPVDTEFTAHVDAKGQVRVNLLQCRPLWMPGAQGPLKIPADIAPREVLFRSDRFISGGEVTGVRYLIYVDPQRYADIGNPNLKRSIGRIVGHINELPQMEKDKLIIIGPGRWGSSNIELGVNVGYADIDHASVLVELAREEAGHAPEVSYGTHFFQDLVEQQIIYLPVFPDDADGGFNRDFFARSPNALPQLLSDAGPAADVVKVIDVPAATGGLRARVIADPESRRAMCFLDREG